MEDSNIILYFDDDFRLEQIPDEYFINMLDYIKYRLLNICLSY